MYTAENLRLARMTGLPSQVEWANRLRDRAIKYLWEQGWHSTDESFRKDMAKLPTEAAWWIDSRSKASGVSHEAARLFLGLEYITPAGADY